MHMFVLALLVAVLLMQQSNVSPRPFRPIEKNKVPAVLIERPPSCDPDLDDAARCTERFRDVGDAWTGDVNGDGVDEVIVFPGTGGTGGSDAVLFQKRGTKWRAILSYFPYNDTQYILPVARSGYHDLCLDDRHCFKWAGKRYVSYTTEDYRRLSAGHFSKSPDAKEASLRWLTRYAGLERFRFSPDLYSVATVPRLRGAVHERSRIWAELKDYDYGIHWISLYKGEVWGVKGDSAFLILPRPSHTGCARLETSGDWLLIYGERTDAEVTIAQYNRRTGEMRIKDESPFWLHSINRE